jgi:hypothetical protein
LQVSLAVVAASGGNVLRGVKRVVQRCWFHEGALARLLQALKRKFWLVSYYQRHR